jgi:hypothetical protein
VVSGDLSSDRLADRFIADGIALDCDGQSAMLPARGRPFVGLWLATLLIIVAMVVIATVIARSQPPQVPGHSLGQVLAARVLVILVVTFLVASAAVEAGPLAAAMTGVIGVFVGIVLLLRTGYARTGQRTGGR